MSSIVKDFVQKVTSAHATGHAREHAYRPALQEFFEATTGLKLVNDPKRSENGAPDFVFLNRTIVTAYAEAKDLPVSLDDIEKGDQMVRYYGYSNLILTNCLEFRFYKSGQTYQSVRIATLKNGTIEADESQFQLLEDTVRDFIKDSKEPIKSGTHLARVMAGKARRIRDNINTFLAQEGNAKNENLLSVYEVIKKLLLADLSTEKFADMYAQTLVYGLFVARYYDETQDTFSRQEARDLVPASNPFLRHFFDHIAGSSFDPRIEIIVNELCEEFNHADVQAIVHNYYKTDKDSSRDPIIHFYEDFLQEYDSAERKKMGVFYTPLPVVRFIVRAVDDILKKEFGLTQGLADNSKIEITRTEQGNRHRTQIHKVQVLDPATGTGTFLNEAIAHIKRSFEGQEGRWNTYVNEDLLPRLHGFELMMASYTIAHLKLSSTIKESGATISERARLGVYLTNSLEKGEMEEQTLFTGLGLGKAITEESNQANRVKTQLPIMVVMGNPPYSGVSSNETEYANSLVDKYKMEPGGKQKLQERKHWLNDDYVKFIAFAEDMIAKNGDGVVGFITNHGYLDNPTFRGMRWHLMDTFDSIYVIDLHGNAKKKEVAPDSGKDENVFAIMQGVSIMIAVKTGKKKKGELAKVYRADMWGKRENKFEQLDGSSFENIQWTLLESREPNLVFAHEGSGELDSEYKKGFSVADLFVENSTGIVTMGDGFIVDENKDVLQKRVNSFLNEDVSKQALTEKYDLGKNYAEWILKNKKEINSDPSKIVAFAYRPFDDRYTYFDNKLVWRPRTNTMKNFVKEENLGLIFTRQAIGGDEYSHVIASRHMSDNRVFFSNKGIPVEAPLWIYEKGSMGASGNIKCERHANLQLSIARVIAESTNTVYYPVAEYPTIDGDTRLTPEDIFDYVYAVLHSPTYREKYKEFLKIDFPRVPYPKDVNSFKSLVALGKELRELHLLESPKVNQPITTFPKGGSNIVENRFPLFKDAIDIRTGSESRSGIYINEDQYFGMKNITKEELKNAYTFYIGGYQPAQKWLKDRQGRTLTNADIEHYQKMIVALVETDRIMKEIDKAL